MDKKIQYQRDLTGAYMLIPAGTEQGDFRSRMILENEIPHFLTTVQDSRGEGRYYRYLISSRISLAEYFKHAPLRLTVCKQFVYTLCRGLQALGEYLLTEESLLLTPDTIYMERQGQKDLWRPGSSWEEEWEFFFCLYPDEIQDARTNLRDLLKYLMEKTDPAEKSEESCALFLYGLYQMTLKENFCASEFLQAMEGMALERQDKSLGESIVTGRFPTAGTGNVRQKEKAGDESGKEGFFRGNLGYGGRRQPAVSRQQKKKFPAFLSHLI